MLPFDKKDLVKAIDDGLVTQRKHPDLPLYIHNYSPECQYRNYWNDVTLNCRGLILDEDWNIVARPWKKFFNLGQVNLPIQFDDRVEVMDKADGSLGILYNNAYNWVEGNLWIPDSFAIATRGSFVSEQALHATEVWNAKYSNLVPTQGYTLLFEIVYPENRIVLDYDGMDDLVLLGAVATETGYYYGPRIAQYFFNTPTGREANWPGPVVEVMPYKSISEALAHTDRPNAEGYVIRSHNFMVKVKQPDYLELHRLVTNVSPKTVWEQLKAGKSIAQIVSVFPDEFHDYVASMANPLVARYQERLNEIFEGYSRLASKVRAGRAVDGGVTVSRKEYAKVFTKHPDAKYFFLLLDNKSIVDVLWAELKPRESKNDNLDAE